MLPKDRGQWLYKTGRDVQVLNPSQGLHFLQRSQYCAKSFLARLALANGL